ncbi:heavy metal translocating P-type ATPase [Aestuariispira insulae]|nr:heavy metal translocating P-type ATPase [Aestuariispira insulae]
MERRFSLAVSGMTCAGCASGLERKLKAEPGIADALVNFALAKATVLTADSKIDIDQVIRAVDRAGYSAAPAEKIGSDDGKQSYDGWLVLAAFLLTIPLVLKMFLPTGHVLAPSGWTELLLATPVQFVAGWRFYRGSWAALRHGNWGMDLLVVLGTTAAYGYSLAQLLLLSGDGHLYFESGAVVVTLVLLGRYLEERAKKRTTEAIRLLMDLQPDRVTVFRDGEWTELPADFVRPGDRVKVLSADRIPVDGQIQAGASEIDERMLTGESLPVGKKTGDPVFAGTMNGLGVLELNVTAAAGDSRLSRIVDIVTNAQQGKAPVQRLVDRVSAWFVPIVLVISLLSLTGWLTVGVSLEQALMAAVSVLVIACPCALGLATPTAVVVGTGAGARAGILFRDIEALERAFNVNAVAFDKTGTLTEGEPEISAIAAVGDRTADEVMTLAASLQQDSNHPLALAFLDHAKKLGLALEPVEEVEIQPGQGLYGCVSGSRVVIGNRSLMVTQEIALPETAGNPPAIEGETQLFVALDGRLAAVVNVRDKIRDSAAATIGILRQRGITSHLISGDAQLVADAVGRQVGVDQAMGDVRPEGKARALETIRQTNGVVAMVGDGINDAPALAVADVGIAMGAGSDIAKETAPVTLMRADLRLVPAVFDISRRVIWKIRQNLFWAFIFNIIGIPLAAFGLLNPMIAGGAMAFSSVAVVSNSLLLRRWKPGLLLTEGERS